MLPFLKPKDTKVGVIVNHRKPDGGSQEEASDKDQGLTLCAEDIIRAIEAKDASSLVHALKSLLEIHAGQTSTDSGDNTYDSRNEKASDYNR